MSLSGKASHRERAARLAWRSGGCAVEPLDCFGRVDALAMTPFQESLLS